MSHAKASLETMYGPLSSSWRVTDGTFKLELSVPPNTTATVTLPGSRADTITEGGRALEQRAGIGGIRQEGDATRF